MSTTATSVNDFRIKLPKDAVLLREGEQGNEFFLLETGKVDVLVGDRKIASLDASKSQEFIGEVAALLGGVRTATIIAATECCLLRIPQLKVEAILTSSPTLGLKLIKSLCRKLSLSDQQHVASQLQQQSLLKSGNTETSLKNYMKGFLHLLEQAETESPTATMKATTEYFRNTNPWKIVRGEASMVLSSGVEVAPAAATAAPESPQSATPPPPQVSSEPLPSQLPPSEFEPPPQDPGTMPSPDF